MESDNGQPVSLMDLRHIEFGSDEKVVVLTTQFEQAPAVEQTLDDVGT